MATDPKKDDLRGSDVTDEQLENVAGGRIGKSLSAKEVSDEDLEGVSGGALSGKKETVFPTKPIDPKPVDRTAEEAP